MTKDDLKKLLEESAYDRDSFDKFKNKDHPLYEQYKDRKEELWHDKGWNNALDFISRKLGLDADICRP